MMCDQNIFYWKIEKRNYRLHMFGLFGMLNSIDKNRLDK